MLRNKRFQLLTILVLGAVIFYAGSVLKSSNAFSQNASPQTSAENDSLGCLPAEELNDELSALTNQPEDNENLCLFVGCNSFF